MRNTVFTIFMLLFVVEAFSQRERLHVMKGNGSGSETNYDMAIEEYNQALKNNENSYEAKFNTGNALYKMQLFDSAATHFKDMIPMATSRKQASELFQNLGNSFFNGGKLQESIKAYKDALRNDPNNEEARNNLIVAQNTKNPPNKNKKQDKKKDKNEDKKKDDKKDKKKDEKKDDKKDEKKEDQNKEKGDKKKENPEKGISQKDAEKILKAISNDEKKIQQRLLIQKAKAAKSKKVEKNW